MTTPVLQKRPMFPPVIDSTMLATFRSCPRKLQVEYVNHWKPQGTNIHLHAGGAYAHALEKARRAFFEEEQSRETAMALGMNAMIEFWGDYEPSDRDTKTLDRMCGALDFYFENYPLGADGTEPITLVNGRRGIEFSFAVPLPVNHPVSGMPLIFSGRADMIAKFAGATMLLDDKTTSSLGASWAKQWELRSQFSGYAWAARESHVPVDGCLIRGVSILKTKYDHQQVITYRPDWEIDRWLEQSTRDIHRMIEAWDTGYWDYNLDHSCADYGGCSLMRVCKSKDPETWIPMYMERKVWDPIGRREIGPEAWEAEWIECANPKEAA